jgi:Carboxypeptidase regulatory-like domain
MKLRFTRSLLLLLCLLAVAPFARSADVTARIKGQVVDPSGAAVPNAVVTATNKDTGAVTTVSSLAQGEYLFQSLPVGTYTVEVTAPGFKKFSASGITLNIDQEYVEPVKLDLGASGETVRVVADAVQVNTTDIQISSVVGATQISELPLIGRNFTQLELTLPGVQAASDRFGGNFSSSGSQSQQSAYLINGADVNDIALNTLALSPNIDALQQFNLITGPLNAEYDRNSGGIVSATVKQGTNAFHGDVFEFYRDTFLNTQGFFQSSVSPFHQNIYGGSVGGPILKDKLFFFGAFQGTRQRVPQAGGTGQIVYSAANRGGDFSDDLATDGSGNVIGTAAKGGYTPSTNVIPGTINVPGCTPGETWSACLTALGGIIPTSAFNPISAQLLTQYVPQANSGTYGYNLNPISTVAIDQYIGRIDYPINARNQIYGLGIYSNLSQSDTLPFTGATVPGFGEIATTKIQQDTFDYVHQFGSTAVNDLAFHYLRFNFVTVEPQNIVQPSSLGFAISPQNAAAASVPTIAIANFFTLGFSTNGPQPRIDQTYQVDDTFSKIIGNHSIKFGYDGRRFNVSNPFNANNSGSYSFNTSSSPYSTGDPSLDFLLGVPGSYAQGSGAQIQADAFLNYVFVQDSWKVKDALTLNYGLGYSIDTPLRNHQFGGEAIACLIPGQTSRIFPTAPLGINYPGDPGCSTSARATTLYTEFGPRVGFAWAPDLGFISGGNSKKFSVRGGFGIYYNRTEEESSLQTLETPPFGLTSGGANDFTGVQAPGFANPYQDLNTGTTYNNRFPFQFPRAGQAVNFAATEPLGISTYAPGFRASYAENFQLSVEREFPSSVVARFSYVGSLGRHNQITYEGNPETAAGQAACLASSACQANRNNQANAFPQNTAYGSIDPNTGSTGFASVGTVDSGAASSYHSGQISVQKAPTHGLLFQLSYTYSHALDDGSSFENSGFGGTARGYNQYNKALNFGNSSFDARHRLVFSPVYEVPFRRGGSLFSPTNVALSGWEVSGILTLATGFPYDVSYGGGTSRSLFCSANDSFYACPDVPVQIAPLSRINPRSTGAGHRVPYFAGTSFVAEPIGSFGNVGRNAFYGPGINNTNFVLAKNFQVSSDGRIRIQLRLESDNVFNHTQFALPNSTVSAFAGPGGTASGTFGTIGSTNTNLPSRQSQLAAKIYF